MKINVYFEHAGSKDLVAVASNLYEAQQIMKNKIDEMKFKSYYTRINFESDTIVWIDYGSHIKFFSFELEDSNKTFVNLYDEISKIDILKQILEEYTDNRMFSLYSYAEEAVCMEQYGDNYIVYIGEKGQKHNIKEFQLVDDACHEVIYQLTESDEEENKLNNIFAEKIKT